MKNQALFSSKVKNKKLKCRLLQFLFGALSVNNDITEDTTITELFCKYQVLRMIRKGLEKISCKLQNNWYEHIYVPAGIICVDLSYY